MTATERPATPRIEFSLPAVPPTLNTLLRRHWTVRHQQAKVWKQLVWAHTRNLPVMLGSVVVTLTFRSSNRAHLADPDSRVKLCLDGIVSAGLIEDDSPEILRELRLRCRQHERLPYKGKPLILDDDTLVLIERASV